MTNLSSKKEQQLKPGGVFWVNKLNAEIAREIMERNNMDEIKYGRGEEDAYGKDQHEAGAKLDKDKPDASLLLMFGKALRAVSEVGTFGAVKYTRGGWQEVPDGIDRYTAALLRHVFAEHYEKYDQDIPVLHAAAAAWNALARLELILRRKDNGKE